MASTLSRLHVTEASKRRHAFSTRDEGRSDHCKPSRCNGDIDQLALWLIAGFQTEGDGFGNVR